MKIPILLLALFFSGWILSLRRTGWIARAVVMLSVPVGAVFGGWCGFTLCRLLIFPFNGSPGDQHNWIGWVCAGILGAAIGAIVVPVLALASTGKKTDL